MQKKSLSGPKGPQVPTRPSNPFSTRIRRFAGGAALALGLAACGGGTAPDTAAVRKDSPPVVRLTGTWWNPAESGTGFFFEHQGGLGVVTFFVYDDQGRPTWYSAAGTFTPRADGSASYSGDLLRYSGGQPASSPTYRTPTSQVVGTVTIAFGTDGKADVQLPGRRLLAERIQFAGPPPAQRPETGIYWNAAENGRGYTIDMQGHLAVLTMFHYAADGSPTWHIVNADLGSGSATSPFEAFRGGQTLSGAYKAPTGPQAEGRFSLNFQAACRGTVQLEGMAAVEVVRFAFGSLPAGAECRSGTGTAPSGNINSKTSYIHQNQQEDLDIGRLLHPGPGDAHYYDARVFADLDGDGVKELVVAPGRDTTTSTPVRVYRLVDGAYVQDTARYFDGAIPGQIHPRKVLAADFNGDGRLDLYFVDHGWDHDPFPGAQNVLALSKPNGKLAIQPIPNSPTQFHHCAAAGDVDNNGTIDIFACGASFQSRPGSPKGIYLLMNDGQGNMTERRTGLPASSQNFGNLSTSELVDVDGDGFLDLLLGERVYNQSLNRDEARMSIYWGDGTGNFSDDRVLRPAVNASFPVVYDFKAEDIDGDGKRDLIVLGVSAQLQGYYVQILRATGARQFADESLPRIIKNAASWEGNGAPWFPWLRVSDVNGDGNLDIGTGESSAFHVRRNIRWLNDGQGNFTRQ